MESKILFGKSLMKIQKWFESRLRKIKTEPTKKLDLNKPSKIA